jgi:hypothetical protein
MYPMHQKKDPWGGQHHCQCPLEQLIGMDQFKTALAKESPEVKGDIALVDKLIIKVSKNRNDFMYEDIVSSKIPTKFFKDF